MIESYDVWLDRRYESREKWLKEAPGKSPRQWKEREVRYIMRCIDDARSTLALRDDYKKRVNSVYNYLNDAVWRGMISPATLKNVMEILND